jgi:hypothetical protein
MTQQYGEDSTPDLSELQQHEDDGGFIRVPVKVLEVCEPVEVYQLPARRAVMRSINVTDSIVQQVVGYDLRRKSLKIWGDAAANGLITLGVRKDEVEQDTATRWPVQISDGTNGNAPVLEMTHCEAVWVKSIGQNVTLSYIAEYWAD